MIYPRLSMARQMLKEEGVILISINDAEAANLCQLCDDVFGPENFIAQMVWEKAERTTPSFCPLGTYILVYARSLMALKDAKTVWREEKPGAREIWDEYLRLRGAHGDDDKTIEAHLQLWYAALPKDARVKLYVKLPNWFVVPTPIGGYNPDWAIVMDVGEGQDRLYLVRETKGSINLDDLRPDERRKIECGKKHFGDTLGVS